MKVLPPFGQGKSFQIDKMEHDIVVHEHELDSNDESGGRQNPNTRRRVDRAEEQRQQSGKVMKRISLEDLFKARETPTGPLTISRVLLYGDPGTGKTCIAKSMAHKWAVGKLDHPFEMVYMLPVRKLNDLSQESQLDAIPSVIVNTWYSDRYDSTASKLLTQVNDDLNRKETLLILCGLDEGNKETKEIISDIKRRECSILITSRPHNLVDERRHADREVECLGFDAKQRENYVMELLDKTEGEKLMKSTGDCPMIAEIMRIPMMAYIVCTLWKEGESAIDDQNRRLWTYSLFTKMVNYVWARFSTKPDMEKVDRGEAFAWLEKISFEALRNDQYSISQLLVTRQTTDSDVWEILKRNGLLLFSIEDTRYRFPHNAFHEYFVGRYFAHSLQNLQGKTGHAVLTILEAGRYIGKYRMPISFMMQALAEHNDAKTFLEVISLVSKDDPEIIGVQHFLLKLRIFDAWLAGLMDSETNELLKNELIRRLIDTVKLILGEVNSDSALWSVATRSFLEFPNFFHTFSEVLDSATETSRLNELVDPHRFGHVMRLLKYSPRHMTDFKERLVEKLSQRSGKEIVRGSKMAKCLIRNFPDDHSTELIQQLGDKYNDADRCLRLVVVKTLIWSAWSVYDCAVKDVRPRFAKFTEEVKAKLKELFREDQRDGGLIMPTALLLFWNCCPSLAKKAVKWLKNWCENTDEDDVRLMVTNALLDCASPRSNVVKERIGKAFRRWCTSEDNEDQRTIAMHTLFARTKEELADADDILSKLELESTLVSAEGDVQEMATKALEQFAKGKPHVVGALRELLNKRAEQNAEVGQGSTAETPENETNDDPVESCCGMGREKFEVGEEDESQEHNVDNLRHLFQHAIDNPNDKDAVQNLLNRLIEVPVTIGQETRDGTTLRAHFMKYESVGIYPQNDFKRLMSIIRNLFAEEYPKLPDSFRPL